MTRASDTARILSGGAVFNEGSNDVDFRVEGNGNANMLVVDAGNDRVGIGTNSPGAGLTLEGTADNLASQIKTTASGVVSQYMGGSSSLGLAIGHDSGSLPIVFKTGVTSGTGVTGSGTEHMRIDSSGRTLMATTQTNVISVDGRHGIVLNDKTNGFYAGVGQFSSNGNASMLLNRDSDDGSIQLFFQDAAEIGSITTSGSTVSYNAFSGSHWSRLSDNSKPTILKGTIIETIDEMCDWYQAEFTVADEEDGKTINRIAKVSIALPNGKSVGDTITHTFEGKDYTAKIIKEEDNKHTKCKISNTEDSKRVYGVYAAWDNEDDTVNDMYVTAVGTHVVRINKDVTVSAGDLLSSNGDGTAKVQDDDIIRSKTIGKVLTNIKQETYSDGSYTVPCALYCG
tara:strand:- start:259 stop:1452 length:1194 start_codon:yes stop_codon:yes gene_type:complete